MNALVPNFWMGCVNGGKPLKVQEAFFLSDGNRFGPDLKIQVGR